MNQPEPKFCVGDVVEIYHYLCPEYNGIRAIVLHAKFGKWKSDATGIISTGWGYKLSPAINRGADYWNEAALRHPPKDEPTTWQDCIFQPEPEQVTT